MGNCYNTTAVEASIETVWETIKDFHDLSWGSPVVTSVDKIGPVPGSDIGAKRVLNGAFHETLLSLNEEKYEITYSIDDGPSPVSKDEVENYVGTVNLMPITDTGGTFIQWTSSFNSKSENEVRDFCNPIYSGLLGALKSFLAK